uniref:Galectin n=1 Tax=Sinocyclocheilus grahami TaxID=75366 RepID=A0A672N0P9_SINGR
MHIFLCSLQNLPYVAPISGGLREGMALYLQGVVPTNILPYLGQISGELREGMALYLQGVVPTNADKFELNFKTGPSDNDDIAFHFNPRMDQKVTHHTPKRKLGPCPHMGCVALVHQVYVNGKELHTFKHRIPLEKVSTLNISGDVAVTLSGFIQVTRPQKTCILNLPYVGQISGGLKEGMALYLQGVFPTNADQFELNFKTGPSDNDDIAFHFNPRMDQKVVMNSFRNGGWEAEESVSDNPFIKGQPFEMFIVYVNGKELCTFKHRIPLEKVAMLNIKGMALYLQGVIPANADR